MDLEEYKKLDIHLSDIRILYTKNYGVFGKILGNRTVAKEKVSELMEVIKKKNLLFASPIIVNLKYEIIDGQHRLEAARNLDLYIHFIRADLIDEDMITFNIHNSNWTSNQYINFYAARGNQNYQNLLEFASENNITTTLAFCFLKGKKKNFKQKMQSGEYVFPPNEEVEIAKQKIKSFREFSQKVFMKTSDRSIIMMVTSFSFIQAIAYVPSMHNYSIFFEKVLSHLELIRKESGYKPYIEYFQAMGFFDV